MFELPVEVGLGASSSAANVEVPKLNNTVNVIKLRINIFFIL